MGRAMVDKAIGAIRFSFAENIPDSGQEHSAYSNDSLFVSTPRFQAQIAFPEFGMFFGFNESVSNLNEKWLQIVASLGNASRFHMLGAFVIARTAAGPGCEMFGGRKDRHV